MFIYRLQKEEALKFRLTKADEVLQMEKVKCLATTVGWLAIL